MSFRSRLLLVATFNCALVVCCATVRCGPIAAQSFDDEGPVALPADRAADVAAAFERGEYDDCLSELRAAVRDNPTLPPAEVFLARMFVDAGRTPAAVAILERAAIDFPKHAAVYVAFGDIAVHQLRYTDAWSHYSIAQSLLASATADASHSRVGSACHAGLTQVAILREDWPSAESAAERWLEIDPENAHALNRLAVVKFHRQNRDAAYDCLTRAATLDPTLVLPEVAMGWMCERDGDRDAAAEWMDRAHQNAPTDARVLREVALWLIAVGRLDEASARLVTANGLKPDADIQILIGMIARLQQDYATAERIFRTILNDQPGRRDILDQLAIVLAAQPEEAKRVQALQLVASNVSSQSLETVGKVLFHLGRLQDAEDALRRAMEQGPVSAEGAYYLARVLEARGKTDGIRELLASAIASDGIFLQRATAQAWVAQLDTAAE